MNVPAVSVLMPVLDPDPSYLRQALASLQAQTFADFELVVVEDPGRRADVAAEALAAAHDARVRHVRNAQRTSLVAQRNQALRLARAELVAMLDADDVCAPTRLAVQVAFLAAHPEIAVLGSCIRVLDQNGTVCGGRSYPLEHAAIVRAMRRYNPLAQSSVMARRSVLLEAGGYEECGREVAEDYELWCRLARSGVRFANLPEPLLHYRVHGGATKASALRTTLRETIRIKQRYWRAQLDLGDRARLWAERGLLCLPKRVTLALFRRLVLAADGRPR